MTTDTPEPVRHWTRTTEGRLPACGAPETWRTTNAGGHVTCRRCRRILAEIDRKANRRARE